jgi:hypothetical protein
MGKLTERIRGLLVKSGNISETELARRMGITPQNLYGKMKRDNFKGMSYRDSFFSANIYPIIITVFRPYYSIYYFK